MLDLHPVVGLLAGSITLVGVHGTGAAYAARLGETMNLQGVMELTMACATAGLVIELSWVGRSPSICCNQRRRSRSRC